MPPPSRVLRFALLAVLVYAAAMVPWPGLRRGYAALFRMGGDTLFSQTFWFWPDGRVRFLDLHADDLVGRINAAVGATLPEGFVPPKPEGVKDTLMVLMNRTTPSSIGQLRTSSRYVGYGPTVVVLALILATPLPGARRFWALCWGWLFVHAFIAFRLSLTLAANGFAAEKQYALLHPSASWRSALARVESIFSDDPTVSFVVPAVIWFLVALRPAARAMRSNSSGQEHAKPG